MKHVLQMEPWGCGYAVCAMILGRTYEDVKTELRDQVRMPDEGINCMDVLELLGRAGYYYQTRYRWFYNNLEREVWPPEPFAQLHLCQVVVAESSPGAHFVVMEKDGTCRDPLTSEPRKLTDYFRVQQVHGLVKVSTGKP